MCESDAVVIKRNVETLFTETNSNCFSFAVQRASVYVSSEQLNNIFVMLDVHSAHLKSNSDVIYFQCQEKEHYVNDCTKLNTNFNNIRMFTAASSKKESAQLKFLYWWNDEQK